MSVIFLTAFFIFSALASFIATGVSLPILRYFEIFDMPNKRSSHVKPVPKGAGLAIVFTIAILWLAITYNILGWFEHRNDNQTVQLIIVGAFFLSLVSWFDDFIGLNPFLRLAAHFLVVMAVMYFLPEPLILFRGLIPDWLDNVITILLWVWFINLFNFMDGIDGIAGVETVAIGLGVFLIVTYGGVEGPLGLLALSISAVGIGFLIWNWAPAKVFMGDSGSVPIGFLLAWLLLNLASDGYFLQAIIIPAYYLADSSITLIRRAFRGEKIWLAHRDHFYQQAVQRGLGHAHVSSIVAGTNIVLVILAVLGIWSQTVGLIGSIVIIAFLLLYMRNNQRK